MWHLIPDSHKYCGMNMPDSDEFLRRIDIIIEGSQKTPEQYKAAADYAYALFRLKQQKINIALWERSYTDWKKTMNWDVSNEVNFEPYIAELKRLGLKGLKR